MPDWRVAEDYAFTSELSSEQWAWEFLRRNPQYRSDYFSCAPLDTLWLQAASKINEHCIFVPARRDNESMKDWRFRIILEEDRPPHAFRPARYYALRWPIAGTIKNPDDDSPPRFNSLGDYPHLLGHDEALNLFELPEDDEGLPTQAGNIAAIALDLGSSFDNQLPAIREIFREERGKPIPQGASFDRERWTTYLRILDAKQLHVTSNDMCRVFIPAAYNENDASVANKEVNRLATKARYLYSPQGIRTILKSAPSRT